MQASRQADTAAPSPGLTGQSQSSARPPSVFRTLSLPPLLRLSLSAFHSFALSLSILPPPHTFRSEEEAERSRMQL